MRLWSYGGPIKGTRTMAEDIDTITLTAEIVAAYAAGNKIKAEELPGLISSVHGALATAGQPEAPAEPETPKATPSQIKKSMTSRLRPRLNRPRRPSADAASRPSKRSSPSAIGRTAQRSVRTTKSSPDRMIPASGI